MKLSTATDLLAIAGLALIGAGCYWWRPFLLVIYAGAVCVVIARSLSGMEQSSLTAAKAAATKKEDEA